MQKQSSEFIRASAAARRIEPDTRTVKAAAECDELPGNRIELIEELNATNESYVGKKLAFKGYQNWQEPIVRHWLAERAAEDTATRQKAQAFWTRVTVYVTASGVLIPIAWKLLSIT